MREGWLELSRLNPLSAKARFEINSSREARLGAALALFTIQPQTAERLAAARQQLTALREENPADDYGIAAAYYLARLGEAQAGQPRHAETVAAYRDLLHAHPGHPIAELAAPKLAILLLYADVPENTREEHVAEILALLPRLESRAARRDTRLVLADALLKLHRDHARAFPLIDYCIKSNLIVAPPRLAHWLLQAAESARHLQRFADARLYYERYLAEYSREAKADEIRRRLESLRVETAG